MFVQWVLLEKQQENCDNVVKEMGNSESKILAFTSKDKSITPLRRRGSFASLLIQRDKVEVF